MESDNWVVQNLQNALETWNGKLGEIWSLITQTPETFKGGSIWNVIKTIHGSIQAIGLALVVLFFIVGVVRTCTNFNEVKRPENALKLFIRFGIAKGLVTYGLDLMLAIFKICQGVLTTIINLTSYYFFSKIISVLSFIPADFLMSSCLFSSPFLCLSTPSQFFFLREGR